PDHPGRADRPDRLRTAAPARPDAALSTRAGHTNVPFFDELGLPDSVRRFVWRLPPHRTVLAGSAGAYTGAVAGEAEAAVPYPSDQSRDRPWVMRTYAGHSSAAESNALYRRNLAKGQTGLSVAFDLPTQTGN